MKFSINVELKDNRFAWASKAIPDSAADGLHAAAEFLGDCLRTNAPRDTGHLADDTIDVADAGKWTYTVSAGDAESPAPPLEFGHRAIPGQYIPDLGKRVTVSWVAPRPFFMPSIDELIAAAGRFFNYP